MSQRRRRQRNSGSLPPDRVLLVEGTDDQNVIDHLKRADGLEIDFPINEQRGFSGVVNELKATWQSSGLKAIGIIVDADDNLARQWRILVEALRSPPVMRDLPAVPKREGTIIPGVPRLGIWVMPDNSSAGELEDFIHRMIPQPDPVWPRAERYIDEIPDKERKFPDHKSLRAKVHAWMATRSRPRPMWAGIQEGDLELEGNSRAFLRWLRRLFGDDLL